MRTLFSILGLGLVLQSGCTTLFVQRVPTEHIVMVDHAGVPVDPTGNTGCKGADGSLCQGSHTKGVRYRRLDGQRYDDYLDDLFGALDAFPAKDGKKRILIYVHGGLNTQVSTVRRAYCASSAIKDDGVFPIFLNWQSNLISNYFDSLYSVRKGWRSGAANPRTWGLAPFYLAKDVARAVTRAVPVWSFMLYSDARALWNDEQQKKERLQQVQTARTNDARPVLDVTLGRGKRSQAERTAAFASYVLTLPTKFLISPILDAAGTPAWSGMLRSAETPFRNAQIPADLTLEASPMALDKNLEVQPTNGGFDLFLDRLKRYVKDHGGPDAFEVTLVGHSMGSILVNRILRHADGPVGSAARIPVTDIVYMAAATTLQDYEDTVFPYLRQHPETEIHHLALHHLADVRDKVGSLLDLPPRGSLLVWIDNFLSERRTYRDRTAGRMDSLSRSFDDLDQWEDIVPRIHIREFDLGHDQAARGPQHHGGFDRLDYWKPQCWRTEGEEAGRDLTKCFNQEFAILPEDSCRRNARR